MAFPRVVAHDTGVEIGNEIGKVLVDGARHVIDVDAPASGVWELGASRAGVQQVVDIARDELMLGTIAADDRRTLGDAVTSALRRSVGRAGERRGEVERQILHLRETPLVFSAPWIRAKFVRSDAERFRPCRIAAAFIERDAGADATPEGAEALVDRLGRWRDLYAKDGKARRAVTATLADHGETASVYSLWGLRQVALSHRAASALHVEVLGALGAHPSARFLVPHMQLVEAATPAELETAVAEVRPRLLGVPTTVTPAHAFPELLATVPIANLREVTPGLLLDILDLALEGNDDPNAPLLRPPIPLPGGGGTADGITFLATLGQLQKEGEEMRHCVYTRRALGQDGAGFFFHVGPRGEGATAQVDAQGTLVEVQGPENRHNHYVDHAVRVLGAWGLRLRGIEHRLGKGPFPHRPPGPGEIPLGGSDAVLRVYEQACAAVPDDDGLLGKWLIEHVARARRGELYLVLRPGTAGTSALPVVVAVDRKGRALAHINEVEAARSGQPRSARA